MNEPVNKVKNCFIRNFWDSWSPQIQSGGFLTVIGMLGTIAWWGLNFVHDTQAYGPEIHLQHQKVELVTIRQERMETNLERLMEKLKVQPIAPDERELEATRRMEDTLQDGQ